MPFYCLLRQTICWHLRRSRHEKILNGFQRIRLRFFRACGLASASVSVASQRRITRTGFPAVCCMRLLLQPPISSRFPRSDGQACRLVARHLVQGCSPCLLNPGSCFVGGPPRKDQPTCLESPRSCSRRRLPGRRFLKWLVHF